MERNLKPRAISKGFSRALYCDLGEMFGLCVEGHVHLAQNTSDLHVIARRTRNEHIEPMVDCDADLFCVGSMC